MEELKVGLYGRTNLGNIIKFAYLCDENNERYTNKVILIDEVTKNPRPYYYFKEDERIVKERKNIIDLIEPGDYLDGIRVDSVEKDENDHVFYAQNYDLPAFDLKDIKSIVTREKFENIEYKLDN